MIGDRVFTVSKTSPYKGWPYFRALCDESFAALRETGLLVRIERLSLKCINIVELRGDSPLEPLSVRLELSGLTVRNNGFRLRTEAEVSGFTNIVELVSVVSTEVDGKPLSGLLCSVDTIKVIEKDDFWDNSMPSLDAAHTVLKEIFFGLLAPATLEAMGPSWET